jgi:hypothetical protein
MCFMPRNNKPLTEQIAEARKAREQAAARLAELQGRQKAMDRKKDARKKIIFGGAMMAEAQHDPAFDRQARAILWRRVVRKLDKDDMTEWLTGEPEGQNQGK